MIIPKRNQKAFLRNLAYFALLFTLFVIVWGALVRATGSGAGCGQHWPLCNGVIIPLEPTTKTIIEFTHRLTSGLSIIFIFLLGFLVFRNFPKKSCERIAAFSAVVFIIIEALIGAFIVLRSLVEWDTSMTRALVVGIHLVNTFGLIAALSALCYFLSRAYSPDPRTSKKVLPYFIGVFVLLILTGASGGIVALGDTLFPSKSLAEGMAADFNPASHLLIRLRIWHPIIALLNCLALIGLSFMGKGLARILLVGVVIIQIIVGFTNLYFLAPISIQ